jgi:hypothetical protein
MEACFTTAHLNITHQCPGAGLLDEMAPLALPVELMALRINNPPV